MRRKILVFACLLSSIAAILSALLIHFVVYSDYENRTKQSLVTEAEYIKVILENEGYDYVGTLDKQITDHRITLIQPDGTVVYDSSKDPETMENHGDRPEIIDATQHGSGEIMRYSDTVSKQTYYYAVTLSDGTVLRVANTVDSIISSLFRMILFTLIIIVVIIAFAIIIGSRITKRIVKPINELNLDNPEENDTYPEFSPLLTRLSKQNSLIKKQVREIRDRQTEFQVLTEHMREGLILFEHDGTILSCNSSALELLGAQPGDYAGKNVLSLSRADTFRNTVELLLSGDKSEFMIEMHGRNLQIIANPITEKSRVKGGVIVLFDITERQQREKLRREFTANVSHELKTPLTSISGYAEIIAEGIAKPDDVKGFSRNIYNEARRMISMINDIMMLSELDESGDTIKKEAVDIYLTASQVIDQLATTASNNNIKVTLSGNSACVDGIPVVIHEMVYNLVDNAIKYNNDGGKVDVDIAQTDSNVILRVTDNGIGIHSSEQQRVFERFYRVDKSRGGSVEGTGLGLSILKHGAAIHNATIDVESTENSGSTFTVTFKK